MQFMKQYSFLILMIILTIVGYLKLKNSATDGINAANNYLESAGGGSMDADEFKVIQNMFAISHTVLGGILFAVGLFFLCFSIYKLLQANK